MPKPVQIVIPLSRHDIERMYDELVELTLEQKELIATFTQHKQDFEFRAKELDKKIKALTAKLLEQDRDTVSEVVHSKEAVKVKTDVEYVSLSQAVAAPQEDINPTTPPQDSPGEKFDEKKADFIGFGMEEE